MKIDPTTMSKIKQRTAKRPKITSPNLLSLIKAL